MSSELVHVEMNQSTLIWSMQQCHCLKIAGCYPTKGSYHQMKIPSCHSKST